MNFGMMGGITAAPLLEAKTSFISVALVMVVIYILHYLVSYIAVKNRTFARIGLGKS